MLGKLDSSVLAPHVGALVARLEHANRLVRRPAKDVLVLEHVLGKLDSSVLAPHVGSSAKTGEAPRRPPRPLGLGRGVWRSRELGWD